MNDLRWLNEALDWAWALWEKVEPGVSAVTNIAALLGLVWAAWLIIRSKVLPHTRFGLHASIITTHLKLLNDAIEVEESLKGDATKYITFFGRHIIGMMGFLILLCFAGLVIDDIQFRLPLMILILVGFIVRGGHILNICEYLLDPIGAMLRKIALVDASATRAIATGIEDENMKKLKASMDALKDKIRTKREEARAASADSATAPES